MKNILIIGASGMIGSRITNEARSRGIAVTEATRNGGEGRITLDAADSAAVATAATGHDAIISAISPPRDGTAPSPALLATSRSILDGARSAGIKRVAIVGGAGSLLLGDDTRVVDQDWFPVEVQPEALAHADLLNALYNEADDLDWSYLSPPGQIAPGERTNNFTLGLDHMVANADGASEISAEDFAVALVDEVERGEHIRQRFTVSAN